MKKHILVNNKEEIFERKRSIRKVVKNDYSWKVIDGYLFQACEYDEQTNILGVNYIAYGIAKTKKSLNSPAVPYIESPAVPYIEALTDAENLEIQQELQKLLCISEMKRLIRAKQEIRFYNTEYGIEGAGKNIREAFETFIDNAVKSFFKDDIDPSVDKEEYREIYFYNVENCEIYLPKKYIDKIWDDNFYDAIIENRIEDEATRAEKLWEMNEGR